MNAKPRVEGIPLHIGDLPYVLSPILNGRLPPPLKLFADAGRLAQMRALLQGLGPGPYIGITWRAGSAIADTALFKEIPLVDLSGVMASVGATFIALQRHPRAGEIAELERLSARKIHDLTHCNDDLEDMLALMELIDDYVGVSNTNMHMRCGAGKPARVLVPLPPEWRWMTSGDTSPWFPQFKIYREEKDTGWQAAMDALQKDLRHGLRSEKPQNAGRVE